MKYSYSNGHAELSAETDQDVRILRILPSRLPWHDLTTQTLLACLDAQAIRPSQGRPIITMPPDFDPVLKPFPYQEYAQAKVLRIRHSGVFLDVGLGKTVVIGNALAYWAEQNDKARFLVIAKKRTLPNWVREMDRVGNGFLQPCILGGTVKERLDRVAYPDYGTGQPNVYIMNAAPLQDYEYLKKVLKRSGLLYEAVIFDEVQDFRHTSADQYKGAALLRAHSSRRHVLSGMPNPKGPADFVGPLGLLHPAYLGFISRSSYEKRFGRQNEFYRYEDVEAAPWLDEVLELTSVRLMKEQAKGLNLPEVRFKPIYVQMDPRQERVYKDFAKSAFALLSSGIEVSAATVGGVVNKLQQITGGFLLDQDKNVHEVSTVKLDTLKDLVDDLLAQGQGPIIVFAWYRHECEAIANLYPGTPVLYGGAKASVVEDFIAGGVQLLVSQPISGGVGLNLQNAHIEVFYSNSMDYGIRHQALGRVDRIGQTKPVTVYDIIMEDTIDERIMKALKNREDLAKEIMDRPQILLGP